MEYLDQDLNELVTRGKQQGYLTYDEVNQYLPDEAVNPEKLDNLLIALEQMGIELVDEAPELPEPPATLPHPAMNAQPALNGEAAPQTPDGVAQLPELPPTKPLAKSGRVLDEPVKWSDDPLRLYLTQMDEIPLLTREQEISLAKKIEVTRKRFRRTVLGCDLRHAGHRRHADRKCTAAILPFDRTIKVSLTERLTKEQIQARMPHNLRTLDHLLEQNREDFRS